jgi:hypothetical protein
MRVEVYRNLHNGMWSVRDCKTGLVVDHVNEITISNPTFVVQPAGRRKVIEQQRKNVHAFVRGECVIDSAVDSFTPVEVTYNPYKYDSFVSKQDETPIGRASVATLTTSTVTAYI